MATKDVIILIKPEARAQTVEILEKFQKFPFGIEVPRMEFRQGGWPRERWEEHYAEHKGKPFFDGLVARMTDQPVTVIQLTITAKHLSVEFLREWVGATDPGKAAEGTLRKQFGKTFSENAIHCSDSIESGARETKLWFPVI